jgi:hypothetical protein
MAHKDTTPIIDRFRLHIEIHNGCWIWSGTINKGLLPLFHYICPDGRRVSISARRYSLDNCGKGIQDEANEIHNICGNLSCVNPEHLQEQTPYIRFWNLVDTGDNNSCWNWLGSKTKEGYGNFSGTKAHRVSYKWKYGAIPNGLDILHKCDNPSCVNPSHLVTGTHQDNMRDMVNKGRSKRGEDCAKSKLSLEQVNEIKVRIEQGERDYEICKIYNVSPTAISGIRHKKTWYWVE